MPDLESQIAAWRREVRASGIKSTTLLDELEGHLRDDIEQQVRSGEDMERAFANAAGHIGPARELRSEFQKIQSTMSMNLTPTTRGRLIEFLVVIAVIAIQAAVLIPVVEKFKAHQPLASFDIGALFVLAAMYLGFIVFFVRKRFLKA
jgi:hypothetical protein